MSNMNFRLRNLVKKKGIGESMSKHLSQEELDSLHKLFLSEHANLTSKATLLTAILMLDKTPEESKWLDEAIAKPEAHLPLELHEFLPARPITVLKNKHEIRFLKVIKQLFLKRHMKMAPFMTYFDEVFKVEMPDYLKAAFLEAQRLKRETFDENMGAIHYLEKRLPKLNSPLPFLVTIGNSFDGFDRSPNFAPFIAAVLASVGAPVLLVGVEEIGPKNGCTAHKVLKAAGHAPLRSVKEVGMQLKNPKKRWGYLDQSQYLPALYNLKELRHNMLKRPLLATVEKCLQPIKVKGKNLFVTGYTHPAYKTMLAKVLQKHGTFDNVILTRGLEGSAQLPIDRKAPIVKIYPDSIHESFIRPSIFGFSEAGFDKEDKDFPPERCLALGLEALENKSGPAREMIAYNAAAILLALNIITPEHIIPALKHSFEKGLALAHFKEGL